MYHYHYHPPLPLEYCLAVISICVAFLLICYQCEPCTLRGKRTVGGLCGLVVGVALGLGKLIIERFTT